MKNSVNNNKYLYFFHRYNDEEHVMHSKKHRKLDKADEIIEEFFIPLKLDVKIN